jgi:hypothetical protein
LKSRQHLRVTGYVIARKFQSNKAIEFDILGLVYHAPAAEFLENSVMRDGLTNHGQEVAAIGAK